MIKELIILVLILINLIVSKIQNEIKIVIDMDSNCNEIIGGKFVAYFG